MHLNKKRCFDNQCVSMALGLIFKMLNTCKCRILLYFIIFMSSFTYLRCDINVDFFGFLQFLIITF